MAYEIDTFHITPGYLDLGRLNEKGVSEAAFDVTAWLGLYPDGTFSITYIRPGETAVYPAELTGVSEAAPESGSLKLDVTRDDEGELVSAVLTWTVSDAVTAIAGEGSVVVQVAEGDDVIKCSPKIKAFVQDGHTTPTAAPAPMQAWYVDIASRLAALEDLNIDSRLSELEELHPPEEPE